mmetsp:Transcript_19924/g.50695  ORF Transcript_19924/g.50695 Transcript_19924/m.50695 type:complete len:339 (+) Transcript_19924:927-1943(+)
MLRPRRCLTEKERRELGRKVTLEPAGGRRVAMAIVGELIVNGAWKHLPHAPPDSHGVPVVIDIEGKECRLNDGTVSLDGVSDWMAHREALCELGQLERGVEDGSCALRGAHEGGSTGMAGGTDHCVEEGAWVGADRLPITRRPAVPRAIDGNVVEGIAGSCVQEACGICHAPSPRNAAIRTARAMDVEHKRAAYGASHTRKHLSKPWDLQPHTLPSQREIVVCDVICHRIFFHRMGETRGRPANEFLRIAGVAEHPEALAGIVRGRRDACKHHRLAVAGESRPQQSRERRLAVGHVARPLGEGTDASTEDVQAEVSGYAVGRCLAISGAPRRQTFAAC